MTKRVFAVPPTFHLTLAVVVGISSHLDSAKAAILDVTGGWATPVPLPDIQLSPLFGDHMVLQRDVPANIWGQAIPGEKVQINLGGKTVTTKTDARGNWQTRLPKQKAGGPYEISITGKNTLVLQDVFFGDVWLISGQSNMAGTGRGMLRPEVLATESMTAYDPQLRFFTVTKNPQQTPTRQMKGRWQTSTPETMANFSAVGYFFGRELRRRLGVPIGLINSSWGGTPVEAFTSVESLRRDPAYLDLKRAWDQRTVDYPVKRKRYQSEVLPKWQQAVAEARDDGNPIPVRPPLPWGGPLDNQRPSILFNGMIAPLIPYSLKGIAWYQGESNADTIAEALAYRTLFPTLIKDWRTRWEQNLPFLFVELANYRASQIEPVESKQVWPYLREAQVMALKLPRTGMATAMGNTDPQTIHPRDKATVGIRLASTALGVVYGQNVPYTGPLFVSMKINGHTARVKFSHTDGGLQTDGEAIRGFAIAGRDGKFVWADARIDGDAVVLSNAHIKAPVAVRYGWADNPIGNLQNGASLPASPFRTDTFTAARLFVSIR